MALPDFLIIGAMKCGTSTLQAQLADHSGIFMTTPKEPNFFSDDDIHARGTDWYEALFDAAAPGDLKGEASTHYTKLPTYPQCLERMAAVLEAPKLIYMIRNPVARAVSHYVHEWTMGTVSTDLDHALDVHPELISYGCYGQQIAPFAQRFGAERIRVFSLEDMRRDPQRILDQVGAFLGVSEPLFWHEDHARMNAGAERIRRLPLHGLIFDNPLATWARRTLVPQGLRDRIKAGRQMAEAPKFSADSIRRLEAVFAKDHARLRELFPDAGGFVASYPFVQA